MSSSEQQPRERYSPKEANLGKDCIFWDLTKKMRFQGCNYPKAGLEGRLSCEGIVDDVCLFKLNGRIPPSLTKEQITDIKLGSSVMGRDLPPGDVR